jgi:signal transduction histidine kinase
VSDRLAENPAPDVRRAAASVMGSLDRAAKLCASTLAFTREDAAPLALARFRLADLIDEVAVASASADGEFILENQAGALMVQADRDQLFRALLNLARNAAEAGATRLIMRAMAEPGGIAIDIEDNGHGLPPRARAHLFEAFTGSARPGGTGLGLAICREIARAHGGDVTLRSTNGDGTCFRLVLPDGALKPARGGALLSAHANG